MWAEWTKGTIIDHWWENKLLLLLWKSVCIFCCYFHTIGNRNVYINSFSGNLLLVYRKIKTRVCCLLLNLFISSRKWETESSGFSTYEIIVSTFSFTSSFSLWILFFILHRNSTIPLSRADMVRADFHTLLLILGGVFHFATLNMCFSCALFTYDIYNLLANSIYT